jgi:hypothetical protein
MKDEKLLQELLDAEDEASALAALNKRDLLKDGNRWRYLGNMPNNQSIVHNQQSTSGAADRLPRIVYSALSLVCTAEVLASMRLVEALRPNRKPEE